MGLIHAHSRNAWYLCVTCRVSTCNLPVPIGLHAPRSPPLHAVTAYPYSLASYTSTTYTRRQPDCSSLWTPFFLTQPTRIQAAQRQISQHATTDRVSIVLCALMSSNAYSIRLCSKRRHEDISSDSSPSAKHRRTASGSDFSTYDIKHALDMPPPPAPHAPPLQLPQPPLPVASRTADLPELLDFSALESQQDISTRFELLASELLHNYRLEVTHEENTEYLEILELEFYLYKSGLHEDPFTHVSAEQSQAGRWFVQHSRSYVSCNSPYIA